VLDCCVQGSEYLGSVKYGDLVTSEYCQLL
jgi:hypothetical protein